MHVYYVVYIKTHPPLTSYWNFIWTKLNTQILLRMATTRLLLRTSRQIQFPSTSSSSNAISSSFSENVRFQIQSRASLSGDHSMIASSGEGEIRKPVVSVKASLVTTNHLTTSQPRVLEGFSSLAEMIASIRNTILVVLRAALNRKQQWRNLQPQMFIERAIVDCRFFTLFAVAGSLLGSVLCFVEGCLLVIGSYAYYFHSLSQKLDQGHLVHLLIEAIDMFMLGTALLMFGVGLYVMFVGSQTTATSKEKEPWLCRSNLFGLFYMKSAPRWVGMKSIEEAKSKIGHAVMMILQVGLIEKFMDIPLVTGLDLACFAAALLTSSATFFVLSRIHNPH